MKRQTSKRMTHVVVILAGISISVSSGCARLYHAIHYNGVARTLKEHPQNYYHSESTGKILAKDRRYCPLDPPCYGYEPTCWSRWPEECQKCPIADEKINGEIIIHETIDPEPAQPADNDPATIPVPDSAASARTSKMKTPHPDTQLEDTYGFRNFADDYDSSRRPHRVDSLVTAQTNSYGGEFGILDDFQEEESGIVDELMDHLDSVLTAEGQESPASKSQEKMELIPQLPSIPTPENLEISKDDAQPPTAKEAPSSKSDTKLATDQAEAAEAMSISKAATTSQKDETANKSESAVTDKQSMAQETAVSPTKSESDTDQPKSVESTGKTEDEPISPHHETEAQDAGQVVLEQPKSVVKPTAGSRSLVSSRRVKTNRSNSNSIEAPAKSSVKAVTVGDVSARPPKATPAVARQRIPFRLPSFAIPIKVEGSKSPAHSSNSKSNPRDADKEKLPIVTRATLRFSSETESTVRMSELPSRADRTNGPALRFR